jgi:hypothetical protein
MNGIERIAAERKRQISAEGWTAEHDRQHDCGELALAAICYAAPIRIYRRADHAEGVNFCDPFPGWRDKRFACGERRDNPGNVPPDPATYTPSERLDLLAKAGALIAAEMDRILLVEPSLADLPGVPEPDSVWVRHEDLPQLDNPFRRDPVPCCRVKSVKDGWIAYDKLPFDNFHRTEESMPLERFLRGYVLTQYRPDDATESG